MTASRTSSPRRHDSPATAARRSVSHPGEGAVPTLTAIDLCTSPCSNRYLNISQTSRISSLRRHLLPSSSTSKVETSHLQTYDRHIVLRGDIISEQGGGFASEFAAFRNEAAETLRKMANKGGRSLCYRRGYRGKISEKFRSALLGYQQSWLSPSLCGIGNAADFPIAVSPLPRILGEDGRVAPRT